MLPFLLVITVLAAPPEKPQLDLERFIIEDYGPIAATVENATEVTRPKKKLEAFKELAKRTAGKEVVVRIQVKEIRPSLEFKGAYEVEGEVLRKNEPGVNDLLFYKRWHFGLTRMMAEQITRESSIVIKGTPAFLDGVTFRQSVSMVAVFASGSEIRFVITRPTITLAKD